MSNAQSARERRLGILRQQQRSGLTVAAFCQRGGIAQSSFHPWKRNLANAGHASAVAAFVEAKIAPPPIAP